MSCVQFPEWHCLYGIAIQLAIRCARSGCMNPRSGISAEGVGPSWGELSSTPVQGLFWPLATGLISLLESHSCVSWVFARGVNSSPEQIVLVSGRTAALDFLARTLLKSWGSGVGRGSWLFPGSCCPSQNAVCSALTIHGLLLGFASFDPD